MITKDDLIEILNNHSKVVEYAVENFDMLKEKADNAEIIKYGTFSNGLGCLFPRIQKEICKGQYGRFLKNIPNTVEYTIYEFTSEMIPLRIQHITEEKYKFSAATLYFFQLNNELYAVPFFGDSNEFYFATVCYRFIYENERLSQFCFFDKSRVNLSEIDNTNFPHIHMKKHDFLKVKYDPWKDYQYKTFEFYYDENDRGKIINLIEGDTSVTYLKD